MSASEFVFAIDIMGTFVFALNGAITASRAVALDIVGILVLGVTTAIGGGILRDVLIGAIPPGAFTHWYYLATAGGGAIIAFFISRLPRLLEWPMLILDAAGLSLFCVSGAQKALNFGLDFGPAIILGTITAVGGGTIRDIIIGEVPSVLSSGLYAIPAMVGSTMTVLAVPDKILGVPVALLAASSCFIIRMAGVYFNLNAPTPIEQPSRPDEKSHGSTYFVPIRRPRMMSLRHGLRSPQVKQVIGRARGLRTNRK